MQVFTPDPCFCQRAVGCGWLLFSPTRGTALDQVSCSVCPHWRDRSFRLGGGEYSTLVIAARNREQIVQQVGIRTEELWLRLFF